MRRQAPTVIWLEHVVLQHEAARVAPIVGDLARIVISHDIRRCLRCYAARLEQDVPAPDTASVTRLGDEAIHASAVYVGDGARRSVWPPGVDVTRIVPGALASTGGRIGAA